MRNLRPLMFAVMLVALFAIGGALALLYQWYRGWTITSPFFVTAADNAAPAKPALPAADVLAASRLAVGPIVPSPQPTAPSMSNQLGQQPATPAALPSSNNALVLNQVRPPAPMPLPEGNELTMPRLQPSQSADKLPAIGDQGQTIWVPRAIEGCWEGSGDASLQYLGGCPNMTSGQTTPIRLRWCFRRMGNEPLRLIMARGAYGRRVAQRWSVTGAAGQSIQFKETISYKTMMFLHVVDVGDWNCRITADEKLSCEEHELARCGPGPWMQPPWFRGSGWVTARRASGGNLGKTAASEP